MNCPSVYLQSKYGRMTRFLSTHKLLNAKKICSQWRKTAHKNQSCSEQEFAPKTCSQQKFAHRICSQHRKTAHDEKPCRLGWINTMAKCFVSSQSEHGWRAPLNGLSRNGWNVLGRNFLVRCTMYLSHCTATPRAWNGLWLTFRTDPSRIQWNHVIHDVTVLRLSSGQYSHTVLQ